MISQNSVAQVLEMANVEDVIEEFVPLKKRGVNMLGLCPFHNEKTPSFTVSPTKNLYKCFGCGKGGNAVSFIMEHENYSFPEAIRYLAKKYGIELEETQQTDQEKEKAQEQESLYIINEFAKDFFHTQLLNTDEGKSVGFNYFKNRGLLLKTITEFNLGYSPTNPKALLNEAKEKGFNEEYLGQLGLKSKSNLDFFRSRIIFPITNLSGKVIAFGGRTLSNDKKIPKYLNSPESNIYKKSKSLYGIFQAKNQIRRDDNCYLVEGYTDVLNLYQNDVKNVVASSGTALTEGQLRVIRRFCSTITFLYDGDSAGQKAAVRGLPLALKEGFDVRIVPLPENQDPDSLVHELGASEFKNYLDNSTKDFIVYWANNIKSKYKDLPIEKSKAIKEVLVVIATITDAIKRSIYVKEICHILEIDENTAIAEINKYIRKNISNQSNNYRKSEYNSRVDEEQFLSPVKQIPTEQKNNNFKKSDFYQEKEIVKVLLKDGHKVLDEEKNYEVSDFIVEHLADVLDVFHHETFKIIVNAYVDFKKGKSSRRPNIDFYLAHENEEYKKIALDIAQSPFEYANWEGNGVLLQTQKSYDDNFEKDSRQAVMRFKLKKLSLKIDMVLNQIKSSETTENKRQILIKTYHKVLEYRKQLAEDIGAIIVH